MHSNNNALCANPDLTATPFGGGETISRSNLGVSPSEVNMQYGLYAKPKADDIDFSSTGDLSAALEQHRLFFGHDPAPGSDPTENVELANMELWFLLAGRAQFSGGRPDHRTSCRCTRDVTANRAC